MRRRALLLAAGAGLGATVAGCLGDDGSGADSSDDSPPTGPGEPQGYESCDREVIPYSQFPDGVQAELDAALDGEYEADYIVLRETMNIGESYIEIEGNYYDPRIASAGDQTTLTLDRVEPKAVPSTRSVFVRSDTAATIGLEVVADDGDVLIDTERSVDAGDDVRMGSTDRVGTHVYRLFFDGEQRTTDTLTITESVFSYEFIVEDGELTVDSAVAGLVECEYDG